jgi:hypothetical protein
MKEINIGLQTWADKDLKVFRFRNGDLIPIVQSPKAWAEFKTSAMCIDPDTGAVLYNWYAVNDPRGLAPKGWKIPTDADFDELFKSVASRVLFVSKFFCPLKGKRHRDGNFFHAGITGYWWTSSPDGDFYAWLRYLDSETDTVGRYSSDLSYGYSVRCLLDE